MVYLKDSRGEGWVGKPKSIKNLKGKFNPEGLREPWVTLKFP